MSEAKGQQHEPSMEEILASIRRIIAEDGEAGASPEGAVAAPKPASKPAAEPSPDEILELTEVVEADGSVVSVGATAPEPPPPPPPPAPVVQMPRPPEPPPRLAEDKIPTGDAIVSPAVAAASVAALSQIAAMSARPQRSERDIPLGAGHLTLEMLVRDELRPILKDWLDRNLPEMVERLVKLEIARLVSDVPRH
jgi:cell pole-organizing protein PopZ